MSDMENYKIHTCYHCGNRGLMRIEGTYLHTYGGVTFDSSGNVIDCDPEEHFKWFLLSCPVCHKATLLEEYDTDIFDQAIYIETLYPQSSVDYAGIPGNVKSAFEAALKVKNINASICILSLRRVLEAICKDKGAQGKNLFEMVNNMIERQILPEMFYDICWVIRELGNSAAHADDKVFYGDQVEETVSFVRTIIEYLYVLPEKMKKMRKLLKNEKEKSPVSIDNEANDDD